MHNSQYVNDPSDDYSLLAIDTAFDICSVALISAGVDDFRHSEQLRKHADDVLPMIDDLLSANNMAIDSLDFLAMVSGPGSFTGLRIGTAVVQGLAFGAELPVVCVSSLAMMARSAKQQLNEYDVILSCLHAREEEFYFAAYCDDLAHAPVALLLDTIYSPQQIAQFVAHILEDTRKQNAGILLAGPGWQHELLAERVNTPSCKTVSAGLDARVLAGLARQEFNAGRAVDAALATPAYLKDDMEYRTV